MPDTVRSVDDFLNASTGLFKDNTAGDISAQDLRDFVLSVYRPQLAVGGRLTTESGVPVSTTDRTAQSTIYYTPYLHNLIGLYDGTSWKLHAFSEFSLALAGLTSGANYDVFAYDNAGTLTLELSAAWTNDTTRADALAAQDGVYVKSGATTRRWLGTIRTTGTTTTEDSAGGTSNQVGGKRFVWNYYNQVTRRLGVIDTTDSWTYKTNTVRQANGAAGNKVEYVSGDAALVVDAHYLSTVALQTNSAVRARVGDGVDSTTAFSGISQAGYNANGAYVISALGSEYKGQPGLGYHYLAALEAGADGTDCSFTGDNAGDMQTGLFAELRG